MNEGWASFWHSRILTGGVLDASEVVEFADCHSGATATGPGQLNPYKLGIELFRYAELRGDDLMRLRKMHNDVSFIDEVVDEAFAAQNQLFVYRRKLQCETAVGDVGDDAQAQLSFGLADPTLPFADFHRSGLFSWRTLMLTRPALYSFRLATSPGLVE